MVSIVYIEESIRDHPRVNRICNQFNNADIVWCDQYTEVFNPKSQNFRLQKLNPALILAAKRTGLVMPAPPAYHVGGDRNYYFSHMLNCIYDCRYCFLQGMFRSAHYLLFVNYEDFTDAITETLAQGRDGGSTWFFSGYDCDSLAYEPVTGFAAHFIPLFAKHPNACLELRTKSTQIRSLLALKPLRNVIVAFSFTPSTIAKALEYKVPTVDARLKAIQRLQGAGWSIGLRFDPLIYIEDYQTHYQNLIDQIGSCIDLNRLHSVSLGSFRMPKDFYKTIVKLYPESPLYAGPIELGSDGLMAYPSAVKAEMLQFVADLLLQRVPRHKLFDHEQQNALQ